LFTIGEIEYLALANSPACFLRGFHFPQYSRIEAQSLKPEIELPKAAIAPRFRSLLQHNANLQI